MVRGTVGREARDLCLLGGQVLVRLDGPITRMLGGRFELDPGALGERFHAELREQLVRMTQLLARVEPAALPTQPFAVQEVSAGERQRGGGGRARPPGGGAGGSRSIASR